MKNKMGYTYKTYFYRKDFNFFKKIPQLIEIHDTCERFSLFKKPFGPSMSQWLIV